MNTGKNLTLKVMWQNRTEEECLIYLPTQITKKTDSTVDHTKIVVKSFVMSTNYEPIGNKVKPENNQQQRAGAPESELGSKAKAENNSERNTTTDAATPSTPANDAASEFSLPYNFVKCTEKIDGNKFRFYFTVIYISFSYFSLGLWINTLSTFM